MTARPLHSAAIASALLSAAVLPSCASDPTLGYSTASSWPASYRSVAVPIFVNDTFDRDIEFELADALVKEIESRTPYVVSTSARADTTLIGRISGVRRDQLSKSRLTGLSEEVIVSVTVDFDWKDARTGETIRSRKDFTASALFTPSAPSGEPIELAQFGVIERLAKDIVNELRSAW